MMKIIVVALILCVAVAGARDDEPGRVLAESDFLWDSDGWGVSDEAPDGITHVSKMVKAGDGGPELWHFVAPDKFLGNMRDAVGTSPDCPPPPPPPPPVCDDRSICSAPVSVCVGGTLLNLTGPDGVRFVQYGGALFFRHGFYEYDSKVTPESHTQITQQSCVPPAAAQHPRELVD